MQQTTLANQKLPVTCTASLPGFAGEVLERSEGGGAPRTPEASHHLHGFPPHEARVGRCREAAEGPLAHQKLPFLAPPNAGGFPTSDFRLPMHFNFSFVSGGSRRLIRLRGHHQTKEKRNRTSELGSRKSEIVRLRGSTLHMHTIHTKPPYYSFHKYNLVVKLTTSPASNRTI